MGKWHNGAQIVRNTMTQAGAMLTDAQAAKLPLLYPEWKVGIDITQEMIDAGENRFRVGNVVYTTTTPHITQENWKPSLATASIWTAINTEHAGTIEDPIPAVAGMEYIEGLIYIEDGKLYRCTRGGVVYYLPSALVGHYFEEVV